ncbi:hypothetical protein MGI18_12695 [Bacillus sp. OVS6]|nr:hypothetical protein MGI18_12695 [Bacillus sp. OVS6]
MKKNENDSSKLQWTFFVIVIPFIFTVTFITVILTVAGVDVAGKMKEAISHLPGTADQTSVQEKKTAKMQMPPLQQSLRKKISFKKPPLKNSSRKYLPWKMTLTLK